MPPRALQSLLILSTLAFSWLAMMAAHEAGHVLHLWATGGTVEQIILHPLTISQTIPGEDPRPLVTALGGPIWGLLLPLLAWALVRLAAPSRAYLARFFAAFCLVANGAYLAADAFLQAGDGRQLVRHGTPPWILVVAGLAAVAAGLALWNRLGQHFGLGRSPRQIPAADALLMAFLAAALAAGMLAISHPPP